MCNQESDKIKDLCKKWNSICNSVHKRPHFLEKVFNISSSSTSSSSNSLKISKIDRTTLNPTIFELNRATRIFDQYEVEVSKPELLSNPNSSPNSASSSEASDHLIDELDSDSLKIALERRVPWQKHVIPDIITTILKNREGGVMRSSWLLFLGGDHDGKEIVAREISKAVFGCHDDNFISISRSSFSSKSAYSSEEVVSRKRGRNEDVFDRFLEAVSDNPRRVMYVEHVDELDYRCLKAFEQCKKDGSFFSGDGEEVVVKDAIVIFSCESLKREKEEREEEMQCGVLDLNIATDEDGVNSGILDAVDMQVVFNVQVL